jgi:hypothetical protein
MIHCDQARKGETLVMQLMIYETAVPVSHPRHGNWSLELGTHSRLCLDSSLFKSRVP